VGANGSVTATGGASGNPVIFSSNTPAVCTVSGTNGSTVTGVSAGTCTIAANQAGNANYNAAPQVTQSIVIDMANQPTLTATAVATTLTVGSTTNLGSSGGSGTGAVSFGSSNGNCTVSGSVLTAAAVGSCIITATKAADTNYNVATSDGLSITVNAAPLTDQTITFGTAPAVAVGGTGTVSATGGASGNAVVFTSTTTGVCTVSGTNGSTVTGVAAGTCTIAANQAGNASYNAAPQVTLSFSVGAAVVTVAKPYDLNGDGKPDLIWRHSTNGNTYFWYMNGDVLASDAFFGSVPPSWEIVGVADFNGDGKNDVVWRNTANGDLYVWYLDNGVFVSDAFLGNVPPPWKIQGIADFNGDSKPDLLWRNADSGSAFIWYMNNASFITDQLLFNIDPVWKVEAIADLNFDGKPDLIFRNTVSGLSFVWYTTSTGNVTSLTTSAFIYGIDPVWQVVQTADYNGDGKPDFVFRNSSTGLVFVWYADGTTLQGSAFITQIDPVWEIAPRP
jgi:hypothetical protein